MPEGIPAELLSQLSDFVAAEMGLYFSQGRWRDLDQGIAAAAREFGFRDVDSCIRWLVSSPLRRDQIEILAGHLTVGETYFFRDRRAFGNLEVELLPALVRSRGETDRCLRIWSAGCATGEEAYSIAILLHRLIADLQNWSITILATDINPCSLRKAAQGVYGEWSFRDTPPWVREGYFRKTKEGRFEIAPQFKKMTTFSYLNLAEDVYPSLWSNTNAMDLILCRNVLMYFAPTRAQKVIHNLWRALAEGGWLIVSPSEASQVLFSQFVTVNFPGGLFYQKDSHRSESERVLVSHPIAEWTLSVPPPSPSHAELELGVGALPATSEPPPFPVVESQTVDVEHGQYQDALSHCERGRHAEAAETLLAALSQDPEDARAMALLARVLANQGHLAQAREWCEKAIAADRLNASGHYLRALILQEQGAIEEARASTKRALYLDPNFVLAHFVLGNLARREGNLRESARHFENALSLLRAYRQEDILPESEGITAGRLMEIIRSTTACEISA